MNRLVLDTECFSQGIRLEKSKSEQNDTKYSSSFKRLLYFLNKKKLNHET